MSCSIYPGQNQNRVKDNKGTQNILHSHPLFP